MLTKELVEMIEELNNVYVDIDSGYYNYNSKDSITGWLPITEEMIAEAELELL